MPLQNRVLPTGEILAIPERGTMTGNRGILGFDARGQLGVSRWRHPHWISCTLTHPKGRYHGPAPARSWTPLFFLDEAVALAAGHRPCAYCRREAYDRFKAAWGGARADEMDAVLHRARVTRGRAQITHEAPCEELPDGTFVLFEGRALVLHGASAHPFSPSGYGPARPRPTGPVSVLTPAPIVGCLRRGYTAFMHESLDP